MLKEITTQYGDLFEVWFDGANGEGPNGKRQVYDFPLFNKTVKTYQPHALIFSDAGPDIRWVGNEKGFAGETCWATINGNELFPAYDKPDHLNVGDEKGTHWIPAECDVSIRPGWFYHKNEDNKVKTDKDLMNIWNKSVGRGSNLLLNIPVDGRGLIHENDEKSLMDFKKMRETYFKSNLLSSGSVTKNFSKDTYDITLSKSQTFNCFVVQEDIRYGQRVKKFYIQAKNNGEWKNLTSATTIGHKRIVYFPTTTAKELRIVFDEAFAKPIISNVALYNTPDN
jgi:alpha-L-fucosidase